MVVEASVVYRAVAVALVATRFVVVAVPDTYSEVVVAPVVIKLVATRLVAVALVKVPRVAVKMDAKKLVEVA